MFASSTHSKRTCARHLTAVRACVAEQGMRARSLAPTQLKALLGFTAVLSPAVRGLQETPFLS